MVRGRYQGGVGDGVWIGLSSILPRHLANVDKLQRRCASPTRTSHERCEFDR